MLSSTSLNFLRRFYLNPRSYQFIGFEALLDCVIHKVKMKETLLVANLLTIFSAMSCPVLLGAKLTPTKCNFFPPTE